LIMVRRADKPAANTGQVAVHPDGNCEVKLQTRCLGELAGAALLRERGTNGEPIHTFPQHLAMVELPT